VTANYERSVVSRVAEVPVPGYQSFWTNTRSALKSEYHSLIGQFPDANAQLKSCSKYWATLRVLQRTLQLRWVTASNGLPS
jgi:hypothetical protein